MDLTTLTGAISFTTVVAAILAVAAVKVGPLVANKAVQWVLGAIKRG